VREWGDGVTTVISVSDGASVSFRFAREQVGYINKNSSTSREFVEADVYIFVWLSEILHGYYPLASQTSGLRPHCAKPINNRKLAQCLFLTRLPVIHLQDC
jgi:hypothetical protein